MTTLTSVTYSSGTLTSTNTGAVSTLDNLVSAAGIGSPQILSVQGTTGTALGIATSVTSGIITVTGSTIAATQSGTWTVTLSTSSVNANGQTLAANSAPVVGASDWIELIGGDITAGSSDSGKPVKIGGIAKTTQPTTVNDGQRVNAIFDKLGKQVVVGSIRDLKVNSIVTSSTTTETVLLSPVASTFVDLYGFIATNTSTQAILVSVKDSSGGTTQFGVAVPSGDTRGFVMPESAAIPQGAVNKAWTTTISSALASGSMMITGLAVKNV